MILKLTKDAFLGWKGLEVLKDFIFDSAEYGTFPLKTGDVIISTASEDERVPDGFVRPIGGDQLRAAKKFCRKVKYQTIGIFGGQA